MTCFGPCHSRFCLVCGRRLVWAGGSLCCIHAWHGPAALPGVGPFMGHHCSPRTPLQGIPLGWGRMPHSHNRGSLGRSRVWACPGWCSAGEVLISGGRCLRWPWVPCERPSAHGWWRTLGPGSSGWCCTSLPVSGQKCAVNNGLQLQHGRGQRQSPPCCCAMACAPLRRLGTSHW